MDDGFNMKVDANNYDFVMYVDASGDDGFKFDKNSSLCYCAAALLVKQEDIAHNIVILEQIKKIVGCKITDEIKYSKIRRHRRGAEALKLLRDVKGKMSCFVIFKKELSEAEKITMGSGTKTLSVMCHAMALNVLNFSRFEDGQKILIAIDRMKHTEEAPLEYFMNFGPLSSKSHPERNFSSDTVFRDSKDANFLLIQISDLLCGTVREHFEQYEANSDMGYFRRLCPNCRKVSRIKKGSHPMCKQGKSKATKIFHSKNLHNIIHLLPDLTSSAVLDYFFLYPSKMMDEHFYIICPKK